MANTHLFILDQGEADNPTGPFNGRIFTCLSDGSQGRDLVTGLRNFPDGIAINRLQRAEHNYIFFTNMGQPSLDGWTNTGSIQRCNIDGSNLVTILSAGDKTHTPKQLVIAGKAKKLYWCDREGMRVMRCDMDGGNVETLVKNGDAEILEHRKDCMRWCVGIQVDEEAGYVYWTQKGPPKGWKGKILRCRIDEGSDGREIETLLEDLPEPIDLELDPKEQWIYWTDRGDVPFGNTVNRAKIPKKGEKTKHEILVRKLHEGIGLALDEREKAMYITDLQGGVYRADLDGKNKKVLFPDLGMLTGIAIARLD